MLRWWSLAGAIACLVVLTFLAANASGFELLNDPTPLMRAGLLVAAVSGVLLLVADGACVQVKGELPARMATVSATTGIGRLTAMATTPHRRSSAPARSCSRGVTNRRTRSFPALPTAKPVRAAPTQPTRDRRARCCSGSSARRFGRSGGCGGRTFRIEGSYHSPGRSIPSADKTRSPFDDPVFCYAGLPNTRQTDGWSAR